MIGISKLGGVVAGRSRSLRRGASRLGRVLGATVGLGLAVAPGTSAAVSTQKVVHRTAEDFGKGKLDQVMVSDLGTLSIAPPVNKIADVESPIIWDMAVDPSGALILGTGNDGKVYRIDPGSGAVSEIGDFEEPQVTAVAVDPDGNLFAATSPDGRLHELPAGKAGDGAWVDVAQAKASYVWDLEFVAGDGLYLATGDPGGLFLVGRGQDLEPIIRTDELHLLCLLSTPEALYAGSANGGYVYRVAGKGRRRQVDVVLDAPGQEAKALAVAPDGAVWVLASGKEEDSGGDVSDDHVLSGLLDQVDDGHGGGGGSIDGNEIRLFRLQPGHAPETLWHAANVAGHSLGMLGDRALLGVGNEGRVVAVRADRHAWLLADLDGKQVTAMLPGPEGVWVAASNPGAVYRIADASARSGIYTSETIDSGLYATWGRIDVLLEAPNEGSVRVETRSGNTGRADSTWSDWKKASGRIPSPPARYVQYRLVFSGSHRASARVREVDTYFTPGNSRPSLDELKVLDPGIRVERKESFRSEPAGKGINEPLEKTEQPQVKKKEERGKQSVVWKASDPDGDTLAYHVAIRHAGDQAWEVLEEETLDTFVTFDASALPDGWYQVRVVADDGPSNVPDQILSDQAISAPFPIDHTPPALRLESVRNRDGRVEIEVAATDKTTHLRSGRYALDGGTFQPIFPADGVFDGLEERFRFRVNSASDGDHVVVVAVEDGVGNVASLDVRLP